MSGEVFQNCLQNLFNLVLTNVQTSDRIHFVIERDISNHAAVAQSVERRIGSAEVTGPIPVSSFHARLKPGKT